MFDPFPTEYDLLWIYMQCRYSPMIFFLIFNEQLIFSTFFFLGIYLFPLFIRRLLRIGNDLLWYRLYRCVWVRTFCMWSISLTWMHQRCLSSPWTYHPTKYTMIVEQFGFFKLSFYSRSYLRFKFLFCQSMQYFTVCPRRLSGDILIKKTWRTWPH